MAIQTRELDYSDQDTQLQASIAWDDEQAGPRPGVLVSHAWRGRSDFENDKAVALAKLGYTGFALDLYGKGVLGNSVGENRQLMQPLMDDRPALQRRMQLALSQMRAAPEVDADRVAAIGFCFGGLCVLDLARSGADLAGVASFHGLLSPPGNTTGKAITARILVMHGWDDPMAPPEQVEALTRELSALQADWQLHAHGNTLHAFSNPAAADPSNGFQYSPAADRRSWQAMQNFLEEILE